MLAGSQANCVGETWTFGLNGRKFDSVSLLSGRCVCSEEGTSQLEVPHKREKVKNVRILGAQPPGVLDTAMLFCLHVGEPQRPNRLSALHTDRSGHSVDYSGPGE